MTNRRKKYSKAKASQNWNGKMREFPFPQPKGIHFIRFVRLFVCSCHFFSIHFSFQFRVTFITIFIFLFIQTSVCESVCVYLCFAMALLPFIFITQSKLPSCFDCLLHFRDSLYTLTHTKYFLFVWMCVWVLNINHECVRTHTNTHNTEQNLFRIIWKDSYKFIPSTFFGCFSTSYFAVSFTLCTFLLNSSQRCCVCVSVCMRFKKNFLRKADIFDCCVCVCLYLRAFVFPSLRLPSSVFVVDDVSVFGFYFGSTNGIFRILTSLFTFISTIYLYAAIQTFARLNGLLSMCMPWQRVHWGTFFIFFSFKPVRAFYLYIFILTWHFMFISIFRYAR